jgi:hypothetical protein
MITLVALWSACLDQTRQLRPVQLAFIARAIAVCLGGKRYCGSERACSALSQGVFYVLRCVLPGLALGLALFGLASAEPVSRLASGARPIALPEAPLLRVQGEACTEACRREHSNCMISEKGSPNCNIRLQRCLQGCLAGKRK